MYLIGKEEIGLCQRWHTETNTMPLPGQTRDPDEGGYAKQEGGMLRKVNQEEGLTVLDLFGRVGQRAQKIMPTLPSCQQPHNAHW